MQRNRLSKFVPVMPAVTALTAAAFVPAHERANAGLHFVQDAERCFIPASHDLVVDTQSFESDSKYNVQVADIPEEWTKKMERRFNQLIEMEALGTLKKDEASEASRLIHHRRILMNSRTSEEILLEQQQNLATMRLLKALEEYARFHPRPHQAVS
jgi:hypothetical protein